MYVGQEIITRFYNSVTLTENSVLAINVSTVAGLKVIYKM